ncbi:MAG: hypothetical protein WHS38_05710 [Thermodesulforhabdaceae bacterium]
MTHNSIILYRVDNSDRLIFVNEEWFRFAEDNDASHLASPFIIGKSLWDLITDQEVRAIYSAILSRVRQTGKPISFNFRCDAPSCRRYMLMTILPVGKGIVEFQSRILKIEYRKPVRLLLKNVSREETFIVVCSWCKRVKAKEDLWLEVEEAINMLDLMTKPKLPKISHGICLDCYKNVI